MRSARFLPRVRPSPSSFATSSVERSVRRSGKTHTFFFGDYEGVRQIFNAASVTSTLPTASQRAGNFFLNGDPTQPISITNPVTGITYNGAVPQSAMTPFARAVLAALPLPNTGIPDSNANAYANNFVISPARHHQRR